MAPKPIWIVFDIGGVIFDFKQAFADISKYLKIEERTLADKLFEHLEDGELGKKTFEQAWLEVLQSFNLHHEHESVLNIWWNLERWVADTRKLIQQLHKHGYHLALLPIIG